MSILVSLGIYALLVLTGFIYDKRLIKSYKEENRLLKVEIKNLKREIELLHNIL
jgi:hypothetical protein